MISATQLFQEMRNLIEKEEEFVTSRGVPNQGEIANAISSVEVLVRESFGQVEGGLLALFRCALAEFSAGVSDLLVRDCALRGTAYALGFAWVREQLGPETAVALAGDFVYRRHRRARPRWAGDRALGHVNRLGRTSEFVQVPSGFVVNQHFHMEQAVDAVLKQDRFEAEALSSWDGIASLAEYLAGTDVPLVVIPEFGLTREAAKDVLQVVSKASGTPRIWVLGSDYSDRRSLTPVVAFGEGVTRIDVVKNTPAVSVTAAVDEYQLMNRVSPAQIDLFYGSNGVALAVVVCADILNEDIVGFLRQLSLGLLILSASSPSQTDPRLHEQLVAAKALRSISVNGMSNTITVVVGSEIKTASLSRTGMFTSGLVPA